MITVVSPDRVVIGGGIAAAGDLLLEPIRAELRRRVRTTSLDEVEIVTAELGTWAGAIGAAIHGAEAAEAAAEAARRPRRRGRRPTDDRARLPAALPPDRAGRCASGSRPCAPGERLPSDAELCAEFGVSRMTARNAMQRLAEDGLDRPRAGSRQLRGRAAGPSPRQPADDLHPGDAPRGPRPELAGADPRHPAVHDRRGREPRHPAAPAGRPPAPPAPGRRRAHRARVGGPHRSLRERGHDRRPRRRVAPRDARTGGHRAPARDRHDLGGRGDRRGCAACSASGPATRCLSSDGSSSTGTADVWRRPNRATRPAATGSSSSSRSRIRVSSGRADRRPIDERQRTEHDLRPARPRRPGRAGAADPRGRTDRRGRARCGPPARPPTVRTSHPASSTSTSTAGAATTRWATAEALDGMARRLLRRGVTSFLPTAVTAPLDVLAGFADRVRAWSPDAPADGAEPLGFNLEGPFLAAVAARRPRPGTPARPGRRPARRARAARRRAPADHRRPRAARRHSSSSAGCATAAWPSRWAIRPRPSSRPARATRRARTSTTHLFNAMTGIDHRAPGVALAALLDDAAFVELIADGHPRRPGRLAAHHAAQAAATGCCSSATRSRSRGRATAGAGSAGSRSRSSTGAVTLAGHDDAGRIGDRPRQCGPEPRGLGRRAAGRRRGGQPEPAGAPRHHGPRPARGRPARRPRRARRGLRVRRVMRGGTWFAADAD